MAKKSAPARPTRRVSRGLVVGIVVVVVLGGILTGVLVAGSGGGAKPSAAQTPIELLGVPPAQAGCSVDTVAYQGRHALKALSHPPYNSTPPASGWFFPPQPSGNFLVNIRYEFALVAAANGGVSIFTSEADARWIRLFKRQVKDNSVQAFQDASLKKGIVLVAWGVRARCKEFSPLYILDFIDRYGNSKALHKVEPTAKPIQS